MVVLTFCAYVQYIPKLLPLLMGLCVTEFACTLKTIFPLNMHFRHYSFQKLFNRQSVHLQA